MSMLVRHAMTEAPKTAKPDMSAGDAAALMKQFDVGVIPIVEEGRLAGLVTDRDLVLRVIANRENPDRVRLGDILTRSPATVSPDTKLAEAPAAGRSVLATARRTRGAEAYRALAVGLFGG